MQVTDSNMSNINLSLVRVLKDINGDLNRTAKGYRSRAVKKGLAILSNGIYHITDKGFALIAQADARMRTSNPLRKRRGSFPRGKTPAHLKRYLFKKGHR